MIARAAANTYRRVHIESASPSRLLDELFVALLADIDQASRHIAGRDAAGKGEAISHALAIISTLRSSLQSELLPEVCFDLVRLYDFAEARLVRANVHFEAAPLGEARRVIATLHEAFAAAAGAAAAGG